MIPMGRPLLPIAKVLLPYLERIDNSRWYSNGGPLLREYEERLSNLFGCYAAATSSGTAALTASLMAQEVEGKITMPAWTFVATANAVIAAECEPAFMDVDGITWISEDADIAIAPFGAPVNRVDMVMLDAAAAFNAVSLKQIEVTASPVVISTHCTKVFSTGEGGIVLSTDKNFIYEVKCLLNHGLDENRNVIRRGLNGKLSEYGCAIGLAELDGWSLKRQRWLELKERYIKVFGNLAHTTPCSSLSWVGSTFCVRLVGRDGDAVRNYLEAHGIASRAVWGWGVHKYEAYEDCEQDELSVTDELAREVVFLPYSIDQTDEEVELIAETLQEAIKCA